MDAKPSRRKLKNRQTQVRQRVEMVDAAQTVDMKCKHCGDGKRSRPRGLCWTCYYDGTRWLTEQVFEARMMALTATVTGENNAGNTQIVPHLTDYGLYLLRWEVIAFVLTTNSGANYWTMRLRGAGATTLASTDSSAQAPGVAWRATITSFSNHAAYDYYNVRTEITVGAPGSLTWRWAARYRLIVT